MAMSPYYVQYLLTQGDLFSRILSFNADFSARQSSLRASKDIEHIKDSLYHVHPELARFHEEHNISYYFENSVDRLCLLRQEELDKLLVYMGACISSNQLASLTCQEDKDTVYDSIGREAYEFALDYGYLIKNLDFMINIDGIRKDCVYLGLCAVKCLRPLFSRQDLAEYFIDFLIGYARSHDLDPNIITSETHVLSVVYNTAALHQAPSAGQMNNFVQYTPVDNHPRLAKGMTDLDEQRLIDDLADVAAATADAVAAAPAAAADAGTTPQAPANTQSQTQTLPQPQTQAPEQAPTQAPEPAQPTAAAPSTTDTETKADPTAEGAPNQPQLQAHASDSAPATAPAPTADGSANAAAAQPSPADAAQQQASITQQAPALTEARESEASPDAPAAAAAAAAQTSDHQAAAPAANASTPTPSTAEAANAGEATSAADAAQAVQPAALGDNAQPAQDGQAAEAAQLPASQAASGSTAAQNNTVAQSVAPADPFTQSAPDKYDDVPEGVGAPLPPTYESAALYGGLNSKDKRMFRAASHKQRTAFKDLTMAGNKDKEVETLEQDKLITLEFNEHQVFQLTHLILCSQISDNWYEYLRD